MADNNGNPAGNNGGNNSNSNDVININEMLGGGGNAPIPVNPPVVPAPVVPAPSSSNNGSGTEPPVVTPPAPTPQGVNIPAGLGGNNPDLNQPTTPPGEQGFKDIIASFLNEGITEDLKADRDALIQGFKATNLDANGNLLNAEGKVVLSADKVEAFVVGGKLPLNENLEVVNDLGEVVKSREDYLLENSVVAPVRQRLEQEFGIVLPADVQFTDDEDGIANLTVNVVKHVQQNAVRNFLTSSPEVKGFAEHIALGGTADTYSSSNVDYKGVKVKEIEADAKIELIRKALTFQQNPDVNGFIDLIKGGGEEVLNKHTTSALVFLDKKQEADNTTRAAKVQEQALAQEQADKQYWANVNTVVTSGKVGMLQIPTTERQAFIDYMSKPVDDNGNSQYTLDNSKATLDFELSTAYLLYKGGDISKVASVISKAERVTSLKERMAKFGNTGTGSGSVPSTGGGSNKGFVPNINMLTGQK